MVKIHGDPVHHCDWNAMVEGINQNGVLSGLAVSQHAAGADMSVDVAAGSALIDEEKYIETSVTNLVIDASESGKHRKDTIIYDTATSAPAIIKGTSIVITSAAAPPSVTADDILLAVVYIGDSVTSITDSEIYDGRIIITAIKDNWTATTDPDNNDDTDSGYEIGSRWINTSNNTYFVCVNATVGAAVWWNKNLTSTTSPAASNDNTEGYTVGSRWINTTTDQEFVCLDATTNAAVWIETTSQLQDDFLEIIRQMHPNVSVLAAMDDASLTDIIKQSDDTYDLDILTQFHIDTTETSTTLNIKDISSSEYTLTEDDGQVTLYADIKSNGSNIVKIYYKLNGGSAYQFGDTTSDTYLTKGVTIGNLSSGTDIIFSVGSNDGTTVYATNLEIKGVTTISGNVLTNAMATNSAVLSFFSHLKGKFSNGGSTASDPIEVEIFGDGDSYAAALNGTTKLKIDPTDPIIELYRIDDSVVAKSDAQTDWVLDDNATNGAFPTKTTSTHETILAEEIGCAAVVMVEKSVNGGFTDTELLVEDDDYTIDYSTRTATKIILTTSAAADIVNAQSKLRITWIVDVENINGTANTALKMKIYLNRTATTEASPEIQPIDLGTGKYAEMKYMCG